MRLGRHMPTHSNAAKAAQIACQLGCTSIQIFASNPTGWRPTAGDPASCKAFVQAAKDNGLDPVVIHAPYLINLASPDEVIWEKSIALILPETPPEVMLLLENDVGAGNSLGHSFEQIGMVLNVLPQYEDRLGVCLDTAHLWGAGHDISNATSVQQLLQHFDDVIGLKRLKVIHLNDTEMALGSHRDVHARLGEGIIGEGGLRALLCDTRLDDVAVLLETPIKTDEHDKEDWGQDKQQLEKAKELMRDEVRQTADP